MPDSSIISPEPAVRVETATEFVVVSWWRDKGADSGGSYEYEPHDTLNQALDTYREYEDGEYERALAIGIFPARYGMPIGSRIEPAVILRLMRETRAP